MTKENPAFRSAIYALPNLEGSPPITLGAATVEELPFYAVLLPPAFQTWEEPARISFAQSRIQEHFARNEGFLPFIGPIAIYLLLLSPEAAPIPFNVHGERVELPSSASALQTRFVVKEHSLRKKALARSICSTNEGTFH